MSTAVLNELVSGWSVR